MPDTADTRLGRAVLPVVSAHPGETGVHPLTDPRDAFAARILMAASAESSLDAQYYIWHGDPVGYLMFRALWQAAQRGVRVRLLLDDLNTAGLDDTIAALDVHPNIEVRLYNPMAHRSIRALNFVTDARRVNRRMHNKSFTVDHLVTVVGGRNIGDEYYGAGTGAMFIDMDVILVGTAVREVATQFDTYWNSPSACPAALLVKSKGRAFDLEAKFAATSADPGSLAYIEAVRTRPMIADLLNRKLALEWTTSKTIYDDPAKTVDRSGRQDLLLFPNVVRAMGRAEKSFDLVSPYFVPGESGTKALVALAERGVRIRILTNSLVSSDAGVVHCGYVKRRRDLLRAGIALYELRLAAVGEDLQRKHATWASSSTGLHTKTFAIDGRCIFVGSFNFDQRSAFINTEMGLVIDSPALANRLSQAFDSVIPRLAYEVRLARDGVKWIERTDRGEKRHSTEPGTSWHQRMGVAVFSILPVDWLL